MDEKFESGIQTKSAVWLRCFKSRIRDGMDMFQDVALSHQLFPSFEAQFCQLSAILFTVLGTLVLLDLAAINQAFPAVVAVLYTSVLCFYDVAAGGACGLAFVVLSAIKGWATGNSCSSYAFWTWLLLTTSLIALQYKTLKAKAATLSISAWKRMSSLQALVFVVASLPFSLLLGILLHLGYKPQLQDDILRCSMRK